MAKNSLKKRIIMSSWDRISDLVSRRATEELGQYVDSLSGSEKALAISRLDEETKSELMTLLSPDIAADLMEDVFDQQAADLIKEIPTDEAAAIVNNMASDEQADLLGQLDEDEANAILQTMDPEKADDARRLLRSPADTAGGLMVTEFFAYPESVYVRDVIIDLRRNRNQYLNYVVQYVYILSKEGKLTGVLPFRQLLLTARKKRLSQLALLNPVQVSVNASLDELKNVFDHYDFFGIPVTDANGCLVGVVLKEDVVEAVDAMDDRTFLNFSGIVGGEELRSMPMFSRSFRRLSWLSVNIFLNLIAASVIAVYQDTLAAVIALAVFLPIISDMSGCSGNQAVAVSIRELGLGQVKSNEIFRVLMKEAGIGMINGVLLGILIGTIAFYWKGNIYLGLVVGGALALNSLLAVCLGGLIPLILKRLHMDPALASSPILTTLTDMCGFFLVLSFATSALPNLGP